MTGDELFERMQNKEFGVILESIGDANELQSILKSAVRAIANVDDITDWVANRNAHVVVADYCERALTSTTGKSITTSRFHSHRSLNPT